MATQEQLREQITAQVIAALESGDVPPWRRPWRLGNNGGSPANVVSKRSYRGLNSAALGRGGDPTQPQFPLVGNVQPVAATGRQGDATTVQCPGRQVGNSIVFWAPIVKTKENENGEQEEDRFFFMKTYTVFNIDQVEGLDHLRAGQPDTAEDTVIDYEPAEEAVEASLLGMGLSLRYGGGKAFYCPSQDYVQIPPKGSFESLKEYYGTVFHELVHATEHESRLNWCRKGRENAYALGELIAELGGVFVSPGVGSAFQ